MAATSSSSGTETPGLQANVLGPLEGKKDLPKSELTTGALSYDYPITVPPGRDGMQPDVHLSYNSQRVEHGSWLGAGWGVSVPYIERSSHRGVNHLYSEPYFSSTLDGELVGSSSTGYAPKVENGDFMAYSLVDNTWTATDKQGRQYKFGVDTSSREADQNDGSRTSRWYLAETRDLNENYVKYEYQKDQGRVYPLDIKYTGHGTTDGSFVVTFTLESRPDATKAFGSAFQVATASRIREIGVSVGGTLRHKYAIAYSSGGNDVRSLLSGITETGYDESSQPTSLPEVTFSYQRHTGGWGSDSGWAVPIGADKASRFVDVNGDGLDDVLYASHQVYGNWDYRTTHAYINNGAKGFVDDPNYYPPVDFAGPGQGINSYVGNNCHALVDLNGDGLRDILGPTSYLNTGSGWQRQPAWDTPVRFDDPANPGNPSVMGHYADLNGDGLVDVFTPTGTGFGVTVYLNTGSGFALDSGWSMPFSLSNTGLTFADLNGDGLVDAVRSFRSVLGNQDWAYSQHAYINQGDKTFVEDASFAPPVVFEESIQWSGFSALNDLSVRVVDVNGDGLPDITSSGADHSYLNTGHGWHDTGFTWVTGYFTDPVSGALLRTLADMDGDGLPDIVSSDSTPVVSRDQGPKDDLLMMVRNSLGGHTDILYKTTAAYRGGQGQISSPGLPYVMDTVSSVTNDGGLASSPVVSYSYAYEGGKYYFANPFDRRFAGFAGVTRTDSSGNRVKTFYHQGDATNGNNGEYADEIAKAGKPYRIDTTDASGHLYSEEVNWWDAATTAGGSRFVKLLRKTDLTFDADTDHRDRAETYAYDDSNGNLTQKTEWGEVTAWYDGGFDDVGSDKYVTDYSYATPVIDQPHTLRCTETAGALKVTVTGPFLDGSALMANPTSPYAVMYGSNTDGWTVPYAFGTKSSTTWLGDSAVHTVMLPPATDSFNLYVADASDSGRNSWLKLSPNSGAPWAVTGDCHQGSGVVLRNAAPATVAGASLQGLLADAVTTDSSGVKVKESRYSYDGLSLGTVLMGNQTKREDWVAGSTFAASQQSYDGTYGLVATSTDPRGKVTSYVYDSLNLYPASVTNALNQSVSYYYDYAVGKPKQVSDLNGFTYQTVFDGLGRVTQQLQPDSVSPSTLVPKVSYAYTPQTVGMQTVTTNWLSSTLSGSTYDYTDGLGRAIQSRAQAMGGNYAVKDTVYDTRGLVLKQSLPYFSAGTAKTAATTNINLYTALTYDPLQRVTAATNSVGTTTTAYDDWKTTITDANGHPKDTYADAYGNLVRVDEHDGGSTYTTTYAYDYLGDFVNMTDAQANVRNFTYDGLGRRLTAEDLHAPADATYGSWSYAYDAAGNQTQRTDAKGQVISSTFDDLNRQLTEDWTGGAGTEKVWTYDTCTDGIGRRCTATNNDSVNAPIVQEWTYNALGQVASELRRNIGTPYGTAYTYDRQGNVLTVYQPDHSWISNAYDASGLLAGIQRKENYAGAPWVDVVTGLTYAPTGQKATVSYANGTVTTNTYDADRLYRLTHKVTTGLLAPTTVDFFPTTGDGYVNAANASWAAAHDAAVGTAAYVTQTISSVGSGIVGLAYRIERGFLPFDTSALPAGAVVTDAILKVTPTYVYDADNDGTDWLTVVNSTQASTTTLTTADYPLDGPPTSPPQGVDAADRQDLTNLAVGVPVSFRLNAAGRSWVVPGGVTRLGLREGHDATGGAYVGTPYTYDRLSYASSRGAAGSRPRLSVTYVLPGSTTSQDLAYQYDSVGNVTQIYDAAHADLATQSFSYDGLDRLLAAEGSGQQGPVYSDEYAYDAIGNILTGPAGTYFYEGNLGASYANPHAATVVGADALAYDRNGSLLGKGSGMANQWYYDDTLSASTLAGVGSYYYYTTDGDRSTTSLSTGANTRYGSRYYNQTGLVPTKHFFAGDDMVAETTGRQTNVTPRYIATDHLTGSNVVSEQGGAIDEYTTYRPYGTMLTDQKVSYFSEQRKFAGSEYDAPTGLSYMGARYYDPATGRFLSEDPMFLAIGDGGSVKATSKMGQRALLADPQRLNSYAYAKNNPVAYRDADGNNPILAFAAYAVAYAPVWVPAAITAVSATGAAVATWFWGSAVGHMIEGDHQAANQSFDRMEETLQMTAAGTAGVMAADELMGNNSASKTGSSNNQAGQTENQSPKISNHAMQRMSERGISQEQVKNTMQQKPFEYFHDSSWKNGYYDASTKVFVGQAKGSGQVTTVINNASPNYINNLKSPKP